CIDFTAALTHAVETMRPLVESHRHHLSVSLPQEPILLEADPTRLEQVICNLLHNAIKYTEPGGKIALEAKGDETHVVMQLRDTGIGISRQLLPGIFDLFTQADRSLARSQGGLGIGLTLVRKLVELMGGVVTADSEGPGKGSEFTVRLPVARPSARRKPEIAIDHRHTKPRSLRVLVVEDIEEVGEMLVMLLELGGHDVRDVHDGPTALVAARTFHPDVILLDIGLPGMNGYDVARQLKQELSGREPIIVAMTGYGQEEDRRRSKEA